MDSPSAPVGPSCCHRLNTRNLIICIDGTANQFGVMNSNVIELYNLIRKEDNQRTWYNSGIGTYAGEASWKQRFDNMVDLAFAWKFEETVLGAYKWLSDNYEHDDCIFLFGFSRGAYQVRVLSAMIDKVGLIHKGNEMQIPFAYELYADPKSGLKKVSAVGSQTNEISMAARFKSAFSRNVKVHFVGAWDTVSSIGPWRRVLPGVIEGMKHVCYFRHALALDECRVKFLPEYSYGVATKPDNEATLTQDEQQTRQSVKPNSLQSRLANYPHTSEVWFAGTHSDIGGGNTENIGLDRRKPALRWMAFEAKAFGLRIEPLEKGFLEDKKVEITESLKGFWHFLELLPVDFEQNGKWFFSKPHWGSPRSIRPGQKIHQSVLFPNNNNYTPTAQVPDQDTQFWDNLRAGNPESEWVAYDLYTLTQAVFRDVIDGKSPKEGEALVDIARWTLVDGRRAVYEVMVKALNTGPHDPTTKFRILEFLRNVVDKTSHLEPPFKPRIPQFVLDHLKEDDENRATALTFITNCTDYCIHELHGHEKRVWCVAFSSDGTQVVSGSADKTVRIWNVKTGEPVGEPFRKHSDSVNSVAFSVRDTIASGSNDNTMLTWRAVTPEESVRKNGDSWVRSVAFSPDGTQIVAGLDNGNIRIWNVEPTKPVECGGHSKAVNSVAFCPDGKRVVSGSFDKTCWIWDARSGKPLVEFEGHKDWVNSVAFSPDGKSVVSGSVDKTVRIWDTEKGGELVMLEGHTDWVNSVVFCPDGKHVVSGSGDKTIRIWNIDAKCELIQFKGHTRWVNSVAFYRGLLVSGSADGTVRIWYVPIKLD